MNSGPLLFLGLFLSLATSFWGVILWPQLQLGRLDLRPIPNTRDLYPSGRLGLAKAGADVYRAQGCYECHTEQVRPRELGYDLERGWGVRRTVAQDYLLDDPVMLGRLRVGPDLANIGMRQPDAQWHLLHLYHPKSEVPASTMQPYRFLFRQQRVKGGGTPDALPLSGDLAPPEGYEIVPTDQARALVAYLQSLRADTPLYETPLPLTDTNAPPSGAAATNLTGTASTNVAGAASNASPTAKAP
jgi:cytochrome c oxidase cbb3-type subunit II